MEQGFKSELWTSLLEIIHKYMEENNSTQTPVLNYQSALSLSNHLNLKLSDEPATCSELIQEIEKYLKYSPRTSHPLYSNQLSAGVNLEALIAEVVTFISNSTMSTYEVSPVATLIEQKLVAEINQKIGFSEGDGIMLTGGSNANLMAIHVARAARFPEVKMKGNTHHHFKVFVSKEAHYSLKKAMMLLGLGLENLVMVETDEKGAMDTSDLERKIKHTIKCDHIPLLVCSTAGTTVLGAFDPIQKISDICLSYGIWHHVDGAWGGAVLFSDGHKHLLEGVSKADSVTFDAHKLLGTGLVTSFFLLRNKELLKNANSGGGSHYLFHDYENAEFDLGIKSVQCGRKVDALKLWLTWKSLGHSGMANIIEEQFKKRNHFIDLIKNKSELRLIHHPQYLNVCFQIIPPNQKININQYNLDLRFKVIKSGKMMINYSSFEDGTIFFRQIFANQNTKLQDLEKMIEILLDLRE